MNFKSANILVTGGTGFIGSHLVEELLKKNANIFSTFLVTDPRSYFKTRKLDRKTVLLHQDVCDFESIFDVITKFNIDYIFHLAAQPLVETAYHNPKQTLYTNILGTINILESARLYPKVRGIVVASSDKAYGKLDKEKYLEEDSLKGTHPYEVSKSAADLITSSYFKTYNLPVVVTRFGNIYGEGDLNESRIIPSILNSILKNETLEIRSDGKYVRDYLYVKDVVSGYLAVAADIDNLKGEAFNFGSSDTLSVMELVETVEKILRKKIKYKIMNTAKNEIKYQSLDYSKIRNAAGWKPKSSVASTIKEIFKWYKSL